MKRLWKTLNTKLPDWVGCLPKLLGVLIVLIVSMDTIAIMFGHAVPAWTAVRNRSRSVAKIGGEWIRTESAKESLRNTLWRRGESWDELDTATEKSRREEALQKLIDDRLIAQFATEQKPSPPLLQRESDDEFQQFLKQFPPPDEWKQRMELQGLNERTLRESVGNEVKQLDSIERWLAEQQGRVTEADARAWFDAHKNDLAIPERVRASHIFLTRLADKDHTRDREAEIRELHRKLTAGEATFEELATKNSDDDAAKLRNGDLGWFTRNRVPPEFAEKVSSLPVGEMSAPFESHLGWHILVVKERQPQRAATFDEMRDEITAMLDAKWREASIKRLLDELRAKAGIVTFAARIAEVEP